MYGKKERKWGGRINRGQMQKSRSRGGKGEEFGERCRQRSKKISVKGEMIAEGEGLKCWEKPKLGGRGNGSRTSEVGLGYEKSR